LTRACSYKDLPLPPQLKYFRVRVSTYLHLHLQSRRRVNENIAELANDSVLWGKEYLNSLEDLLDLSLSSPCALIMCFSQVNQLTGLTPVRRFHWHVYGSFVSLFTEVSVWNHILKMLSAVVCASHPCRTNQELG
jgi:hypothetical protein